MSCRVATSLVLTVSVTVSSTVSCSSFDEADRAAAAPAIPSVIAGDVDVQGLVASRDRVAWLAGGRLFAKLGDAAPYLAAEPLLPQVTGHVIVDGDDVLFSTGALLTRCAITGAPCARNSPVPGLNSIGPLAIRDRTLMVTNTGGPGSVLYACLLPSCGGGAVNVAKLAGPPARMVATTSATIVAVELGASGNTSLVKYVGSDATAVASDIKALTGLATDGTSVYWTDAGTGAVRAAPVQGGAARDVASGRSGPRDVVVDGAALYWLEADAGKVLRCALPDCITPTVVAEVEKPVHLAVGDTRIVFASRSRRALLAVPK